jgi:hypothetical protein
VDKTRREYILDSVKSVATGAVAGTAIRMEMNEGTSIQEFMGKNSAQYILRPEPHLNPQATQDIDIREFIHSFSHETDEMNGLYDIVRDVSRTIKSDSGDCVDFSAVAASWILQHTNQNPKLVLYSPSGVDYGHINVYAGGQIYDYHGIYNKNPENYAKSYNDISLLYVTDPISG